MGIDSRRVLLREANKDFGRLLADRSSSDSAERPLTRCFPQSPEESILHASDRAARSRAPNRANGHRTAGSKTAPYSLALSPVEQGNGVSFFHPIPTPFALRAASSPAIPP